jgi:hypothetical protein
MAGLFLWHSFEDFLAREGEIAWIAISDGRRRKKPVYHNQARHFYLRSKPVPSVFRAEADARSEREQLIWLARISPKHVRQLHSLIAHEAQGAAEREQLEWLASISTTHESQLRDLLGGEAKASAAHVRIERFVEDLNVQEAQWDPAKHPRRGTPPNAGWFAPTGGAGGSAAAGSSSSFFKAVIQRNRALADLTGGPTAATMRSTRLAIDLESAARLPGAVAATLPRKPTPTKSPASRYEIKHTGPYNYTVSGGGDKIDIDGFRGSTILETKFIDNPSASPFVPGSSIPDTVRATILKKVRDELTRLHTVIRSGSTPFESVEIVTNSPEAKNLFQAMLKDLSVPGTVRVEP